MARPLNPNPFNPSPEVEAQLLSDFLDASLTLTDLATRHNTTLCALCEWFDRPHIKRRLSDIHAASRRRVQLAAARALPKAVNTLTSIILQAAAATPNTREARNAAKAAKLLLELRIRSITPRASKATPPTPPTPSTPTLRARLLPHAALPPGFNPANN